MDGARCLLIAGIGMECGARYVDRQLSASGLSGQRKATAGTGAGPAVSSSTIHATTPWQPTSTTVYDAVRWYHRQETGANPLLAELYAPIIPAILGAQVTGGGTPSFLIRGGASANIGPDCQSQACLKQ